MLYRSCLDSNGALSLSFTSDYAKFSGVDVTRTQSDDSLVGQKRLLALEQKFVELSMIVESLQTEV